MRTRFSSHFWIQQANLHANGVYNLQIIRIFNVLTLYEPSNPNDNNRYYILYDNSFHIWIIIRGIRFPVDIICVYHVYDDLERQTIRPASHHVLLTSLRHFRRRRKIPNSVACAASLPLPPSWVACTLPGERLFYHKKVQFSRDSSVLMSGCWI